MEREKALLTGIVQLVVLVLFSSSVLALPMAEISYIETDLGGGTFQYEYNVTNSSDPVIDAGFNIFDVFFEFEPAVSLTIVSVPTDWDYFTFLNPSSVEVDTFSLLPGIPPAGADIAPGTSLNGFIFQYDRQVSNSPFKVLFDNPNNPPEPLEFGGTTAPVPEPATILLLTTGALGMGVFGRKKFRIKK